MKSNRQRVERENFIESALYYVGADDPGMTLEDAERTFDAWREEGIEIPEGLTPIIYGIRYNDHILKLREEVKNAE